MTLDKKKVKDFSNNPIPSYYWEKDVKQFLKDLQDFIDDKTYIKEKGKIIRFMPFEFEEFLKEKVGDLK